MAASAAETLRIPQRVATATAAREARKLVERQRSHETGHDPEDTSNVIQSTEVALDLMERGYRQPQAGLRQALKSYDEV